MYADLDSRGRYSIMDLTPDEFETIRRAIKAFRTGMITSNSESKENECHRQYIRATKILNTLSELP